MSNINTFKSTHSRFIAFEPYIDDGLYTGNATIIMLKQAKELFKAVNIDYFNNLQKEYYLINDHLKNINSLEDLSTFTKNMFDEKYNYYIYIAGWTGHAIGYVIKKNKNKDNYDFIICNRGEGVELHGYGVKLCKGIAIYENYNKEIIDNFLYYAMLLSYGQNQNDVTEKYDLFINELFINALNILKTPTHKIVESQKTGSCTTVSFMTCLLYIAIDKGETELYNISYDKLVYEILKQLINFYVDANEITIEDKNIIECIILRKNYLEKLKNTKYNISIEEINLLLNKLNNFNKISDNNTIVIKNNKKKLLNDPIINYEKLLIIDNQEVLKNIKNMKINIDQLNNITNIIENYENKLYDKKYKKIEDTLFLTVYYSIINLSFELFELFEKDNTENIDLFVKIYSHIINIIKYYIHSYNDLYYYKGKIVFYLYFIVKMEFLKKR